MPVMPAEIPTGLVTGQFYFVSEDAADTDTDPELEVVSGFVRFTSSARILRMPAKGATIIPLAFDAKFNTEGQLVSVGDTNVGLKLPATDSDLINPKDYTWRVEFFLKRAVDGTTVQVPSFSIAVPEGGTVDLTAVMPIAESNGVPVLQGVQGKQGDPGPASTVPGPANVLSIGTVAKGDTAQATITGTAPAQTLNLVLPKGDPGPKGDTGDDGGGPPLSAAALDPFVAEAINSTSATATKAAVAAKIGEAVAPKLNKADLPAEVAKLPDNGYLMATFLGNGVNGEKLSLFYSPDGKTLYGNSGNPIYTPVDGQGVRDPSILYRNNRFYIAHTSNNGHDKDMAIAVSDGNNVTSWSLLTSINASSITKLKDLWAPEFIVDGEDVYIFFTCIDTNNIGTMYWIRATNTQLTTWTAPQAVNFTNPPASYIDGVPIKDRVDGKWYMFYSVGTTIERAVATTLTGTWTVDRTGNWAGWGSGIEGPNIVRDGDKYRIYYDRYTVNEGLHWSEADHLNATWSPAVKLKTTPGALQASERIRHGGFYKLPSQAVADSVRASFAMSTGTGRHKEFRNDAGFDIARGVFTFASGVVTDPLTDNDALVTYNASDNTFAFNREATYAVSAVVTIKGSGPITRSLIDMMDESGAVVARGPGGIEDVFTLSIPNYKTRPDEKVKFRLFAEWSSGTGVKASIRIRFTRIG